VPDLRVIMCGMLLLIGTNKCVKQMSSFLLYSYTHILTLKIHKLVKMLNIEMCKRLRAHPIELSIEDFNEWPDIQ